MLDHRRLLGRFDCARGRSAPVSHGPLRPVFLVGALDGVAGLLPLFVGPRREVGAAAAGEIAAAVDGDGLAVDVGRARIEQVDRQVAENAYEERKDYIEIGQGFLEEVPRLIGNACFLVLELSVLQSPMFSSPLSITAALLIFIAALAGFHYLNKWIANKLAMKSWLTVVPARRP